MASQNFRGSSSSKPDYDGGRSSSSSIVKHNNDSETSLQQLSIEYKYLTYDTELPPISESARHLDGQLDSGPNLARYQSPYSWSRTWKNVTLLLVCVATAFASFAAGSYAPGVAQMSHEWHVSRVACLTGITAFTVGFGVAPMAFAAFSELNGRRPVLVVSGIVFALGQLCCALTPTFAGVVVSRFVVGMGGSTFSTVVAGCIAEINRPEDRNTVMAFFSGSVFVGTGLGPLCASFIADSLSWRWIFWLQLIMEGALLLGIVLFFRETRHSVLLSRMAGALNAWYEQCESASESSTVDLEKVEKHMTRERLGAPSTTPRIRWKVKADEERASLAQMLRISLVRPFHLLITEPVVFFFSLWVSFSWAVLYLFFSAVPLVMRTSYGFDLPQTGAVFSSISIGGVIATVMAIYQEDWAIKHKLGQNWPGRFKLDFSCPEGRLYFACVESLLLPIGIFIFGWTATPTVHWIVPSIGLAIATMGIFSIYLATFNYLADSYEQYASSALAAQSFCRNMLGGAAPLFTVQMYTKLGFGGASSLLGGFALLLSLVPWVLALYGPTIRARSRFAIAHVQQ